jgi:DNA replication protein DnaC
MEMNELRTELQKIQDKLKTTATYSSTEHKLHAKEIANLKFHEAYIKSKIDAEEKRIAALKETCNLGARFSRRTFQTWKKDHFTIAEQTAFNYALEFPNCNGQGLIFTGDVGTGKTHLAAAIANYVMDEYVNTVYFSGSVEMLNALKSSYNAEDKNASSKLMNIIHDCDLLIIDDLGKEKLTEWSRETLYGIINYRYEHELPIIITTNYNANDLANRIGQATMSRLYEMCGGITMRGKDYRKHRGM